MTSRSPRNGTLGVGVAAMILGLSLGTGSAAAGSEATRVNARSALVQRPARIDTADYTFFDETRIRVTGLRWSRWGASRTTARGRLVFSVADYVRRRAGRGRVILSQPRPLRCGGRTFRVYRQIEFRSTVMRATGPLPLPGCPGS